MEPVTLIVITNNYPLGGRTEEAFLKSEIQVLAARFEKVVVAPMWKESDCFDIAFWPDNVSLDDRLSRQYREHGKKRYLNLFNRQLIKALLRETWHIENRVQLEYLISTFVEGKAVRDYVESLENKDGLAIDHTVIYSFWFADHMAGMGLIRPKNRPRWISRSHHYDLYDDRVPIRSRIFRDLSFQTVERVLCCSRQGMEYLADRYPNWKDKITTLYLGTSKPEMCPEFDISPRSLSFVTVARMEPVKRPCLTLDFLYSLAMRYPEYEVSWTVIGDGSLLEQLMNMARIRQIHNFKVVFLGGQSNSAIHSLFERTQFNWMIMLSESEGLPISFAEAMSYGIPSIATDVGGVKEEVIPGMTGILLSQSPEFDEFSKGIGLYLTNTELYLELRRTSRDFWEKNLDGARLKEQLADIISGN